MSQTMGKGPGIARQQDEALHGEPAGAGPEIATSG
jgi:hypothetical protein